jgi:hypothetical protein
MGANTIFGHFFPFLLIMVLNILIVKILKENQQNMQGLIQDEYTVCDLPNFELIIFLTYGPFTYYISTCRGSGGPILAYFQY